MVLKNLCVLVLWTRVASALERSLLDDSEGDTANSACDTSTMQLYYAILQLLLLQFRHLIPAQADRGVYQYLVVQTPMDSNGNCSLGINAAFSCGVPGNWAAIGRAVLYYERTAHNLVHELNYGNVAL